MHPSWNDASLSVGSDTPRTARYRLAQSRWRETILGLPPGHHSNGRLVGSMLAADAPVDAQWLTPHVEAYVAARLPAARAAGEAIEEDRLRRNLLSSQPLCFNVFGQFAAYPAAAARVLTGVLDVPVDAVEQVLVEHAPPAAKALLSDRSAFDAYLVLTIAGTPSFLGVEVKYTEPFSTKEYDSPAYRTTTGDAEGWFVADAADAARSAATNQLWRTAMLAQLTEQSSTLGGGCTGAVMVLCLEGDQHAAAAVAGVRRLLKKGDRRLSHVTFQQLVAAAAAEADLSAWARLFSARYLL